jgi:nitrogen fixation protein NifB
MTARLAFAGDSENRQLEHFGHAQEFVVYDLDDEAAALVETRAIDAFCAAGPRGDDALAATTDLLRDCQIVISAAVGPCVQNALANSGLLTLEFEGTIDEALRQLVARGFGRRYAPHGTRARSTVNEVSSK